MKTLGRYLQKYRSKNDVMVIELEVENESVAKELEEHKDKDYFISIEQYQEKRSLQANRYLWKLCDLIGAKLHLSKDAIYMLKLADYGVFVDIRVKNEAYSDILARLKQEFRFIQDMSEDHDYRDIRCYIGSSHYNKAEMQRLLTGVVQDARDLGIETWDDEEIDMLVKAWKGGK